MINSVITGYSGLSFVHSEEWLLNTVIGNIFYSRSSASVLDYPLPGGSICPDWDIPEVDSSGDVNTKIDEMIRRYQEALETGLVVLDAKFIKDAIDEALKDIVGDTTGVLLPDRVIDWEQSDIIADTVLDTDKPAPSPTPGPTSSPSPSPGPSPKPDYPINKLPPGINTKFPFSLPWDIYYLIKKMQAEPVPPKFVIPINLPSVNYYEEIVLDIGEFEEIAVVVRWGMTLLFVLGLVMLTRKLVK